jgi:N4-gp56 family major capsid protein
VEKAKTISPVIRPARIEGFSEPLYVLFVHPYQVTSLRTTSAGLWRSIQDAAMQGGKVNDNPMITGALGIYNNVLLVENTRVPQGVRSDTGAAVANLRCSVCCDRLGSSRR